MAKISVPHHSRESAASFVLQEIEDSCYLLTEDWLYLVMPKIGYSNTEDQAIQILRTSLPAGDTFELGWEELPAPEGVTAGDYGNWSYLHSCSEHEKTPMPEPGTRRTQGTSAWITSYTASCRSSSS